MKSRQSNSFMKSSPSLDFTSELFDPAKVLSSSNVSLLFPKAKTYNNVAEYYTHAVLKKNLEERKIKETPIGRNYPWFIKTLGFSGRRATIVEENLKKRRDRNKRIGKKPISITYLHSAPLRSEKVIKLKSCYKEYWRRKRLLFKRANRSSSDSKDETSLFHKIKWLAKPLSATELITKAIQLSTAQTDISEKNQGNTGEVEGSLSTLVGCQNVNSPDLHEEVKEADLTCKSIILVVDNCRKKRSKVKVKRLGKSDKHLVSVKSRNGHKSSKRKKINAKHSNSSQLENKLDKIDPENFKQNHSKNVLTSKENVDSFQTKQFKDFAPKSPIQVKINNTFITTKGMKSKNSEETLLKDNASNPIKRCKCFPKVSVELFSQCSCGLYSTAMNNLRKFKIPRKKKF